MRFLVFFFSLLLLILIVGGQTPSTLCSAKITDNVTQKVFSYDLSVLNVPDDNDADFYFSFFEGSIISFNICGLTLYKKSPCRAHNSSACLHSLFYDEDAGSLQDMRLEAPEDIPASEGIDVVYYNGTLCSNGIRFKTRIRILCSDKPNEILEAVFDPPCGAFINFYSLAGCGIPQN